jgi:hypothetical protein
VNSQADFERGCANRRGLCLIALVAPDSMTDVRLRTPRRRRAPRWDGLSV